MYKKANTELWKFLFKIPMKRRMDIFRIAGTAYGMPKPADYNQRVKRTELKPVEVSAIMKAAAQEGYTPDSIREAEELANQLKTAS